MALPQWLAWMRPGRRAQASTIPDDLWQPMLARYPFLLRHGAASGHRLRELAQQFLAQKEFHGAAGLQVSDEMALAIAAQACLPVLGIAGPRTGLAWYSDFVGIVVYPGAMRARREMADENGVVHAYDEELTGEAMHEGPVALSWQDVHDAGTTAADGYNVVIHEFIHKIDLCDGVADGCPALPRGFMGSASAAQARQLWRTALQASFEDFNDRLSLAERFGGAPVWLDPYGASAPDEFFAVAGEAYFVNPGRFASEFPALVPLFDAFFSPGPATG